MYGVAAVPEKVDSSFGHLVIITEAGIKNALQLYQDEGKSIPLYVTCDLWSRLAAAVHCIHSKRIIHQDLKPENILVTAVIILQASLLQLVHYIFLKRNRQDSKSIDCSWLTMLKHFFEVSSCLWF